VATEVELIDNTAKDGVLDLTGQAGPATNVTAEPDTGTTIDNETGKVDEPELGADGEPVVKAEPEPGAEVKDEGTTEEEAETFYFGDQAVEVTVPDEISAALTEAGVDQKALLAELFAKEGKFELSEDTRGKLEAKFGKLMVDGYLNMYKGLNDQTIAKHAQEQTSAAEQTAAMQSEYKELVGGEEGLNKLESYILSNFDEKQIGSYNAIMGGDNWEAQKMVIQMARQQMAAHDKQTNGDRSIELLTDGGETAHKGDDDVTVKGYITGAEYQKLMDSDKYWSDRDYQRKVDSMRSQSIRSGR